LARVRKIAKMAIIKGLFFDAKNIALEIDIVF
jgi:hypothetical protein